MYLIVKMVKDVIGGYKDENKFDFLIVINTTSYQHFKFMMVTIMMINCWKVNLDDLDCSLTIIFQFK